jgi:hypothetical protein
MPARRSIEKWLEDGRRVLRCLGALDEKATRGILRELRREPEREVVIDVGLARGFDEVGVAALARIAEGIAGRRVVLRGLSTHQWRILRYLGTRLADVGASRSDP